MATLIDAIAILGTRMASRYAGVSRRTVQRWVNGERFPTPMQRNAVAIGLGEHHQFVGKILDEYNKEVQS